MFIFIPQLGYMLAVEKNKTYFKFINRVSKQFLEKQENSLDDEEEKSLKEEESINNITISISTSNKNTNNPPISEIKDATRSNYLENDKINRSILFSEIEEDDENGSILENDEEDDEDNDINNFD